MINPLERAEEIERHVCKHSEKKYFRFRGTKFYGGISTADCVGCNINCVFCWNYRRNQNFKRIGEFYSPEEVADKLVRIADENNFSKVRITGGEPTIGREHLLQVLEKIPERYLFILETNGILLGKYSDYVRDLSNYDNLHVRVSLKGTRKEEFEKLTKAGSEFYSLQFDALKNLRDEGASYHASVMTLEDDLRKLRQGLAEIDPGMRLEKEKLKLYSHVKSRMKEGGLI